MEFIKDPQVEELQTMSMKKLKEIASLLEIEVTEVTPSKNTLVEQITQSLVAQGKISVSETKMAEESEEEECKNSLAEMHTKMSPEMLFQLEIKRMELASQERIELAKIKAANGEAKDEAAFTRGGVPPVKEIDLLKFKKLVPIWVEDPSEIENFFRAYEQSCKDYNFPPDKWAMLVRSAFTKGKARECVLSMSEEDINNYQVIKEAILLIYAQIPENYRKRFRQTTMKSEQTHLDFMKQQERLLERWMKARKVETLKDMKNLIVVEDFMDKIRSDVRLHIAERDISSPTEVAKVAEQFILCHKSQLKRGYSADQRRPTHVNNTGTTFEKPGQFSSTERKFNNKIECTFCKRKGHLIADCWKYKAGQTKKKVVGACIQTQEYKNSRQHFSKDSVTKTGSPKGKREINTSTARFEVSEDTEPTDTEMNCKATIALSIHTNGRQVETVDPRFNIKQDILSRSENEILKKKKLEESEQTHLQEFQPFISEGYVAVAEDRPRTNVSILRDTGSSLSVIVKDVLPLTEETFTGQTVLIRGVEMGQEEVPLHRIYLSSNLVTGYVIVGVKPELPFKGISILLGNDLAKGRILPDPIVTVNPDPTMKEENEDLYPNCAITRGMLAREKDTEQPTINLEEKEEDLSTTIFTSMFADEQHEGSDTKASRKQLIADQKTDPELRKLRETVAEEEERQTEDVNYYIENDMLMRRWRPADASADEEWREKHQIVVPPRYRKDILYMAHDALFSGHLGIKKTYHRILPYFYWPGLKKDVISHCKTCHTCQVVGKPNQVIPVANLQPIPAIQEAFAHIIVDCVGPLPRTKTGHQYILTIMCSATRYPEAIPLRNITAEKVSDCLTEFFTRYGLPKSIQTDRGSNFTSKLFSQVLKTLGVQHHMSTAYHPESQGALERFHQTMKTMLRTYCHEHQKDWDKGLPLVLFAAREAVQESLGFSPFELIFGHTVRGPLKLLQEAWMSETEPTGLLKYIDKYKNRLFSTFDFVHKNLESAQKKMKTWYDKRARKRSFAPGDQVLLLLPAPGNPLNVKFFGPYEVEAKVSEVNYLLKTPDRKRKKRLCHINMIKPYFSRENNETQNTVKILSPLVSFIPDSQNEWQDRFTGCKLNNSQVLQNLEEKLGHLNFSEKKMIENLIAKYSPLFKDIPSRTNLIEHDVILEDSTPIKQHPYRINPRHLALVRKEIAYMLENDMIELSNSNWASPIVLVAKADNTVRLCTDFRKVNAVTKTDPYPIPRVDDLIDKIGNAEYVTKIDLLTGYWQVPLTKRAQEISSFITPDGLYKYKVMPFGMRNSPSTFQRLMNHIIRDIPNCQAYLDDIVIYSNTFQDHINLIEQLFTKLLEANLTINLSKSHFGHATIEYLGHVVGNGKVKPVNAKIEAIQKIPIPTNKKQIRSFLGMAGYYRKFCPNFSVIASPLTNLLKKNSSYTWTPDCDKAFNHLKLILSHAPILTMPNFDEQFYIMVDSCNIGTGSVLFQKDQNGIEKPISYFSQKFNSSAQRYSTIEKELFGIILSLKQFDFYISGSPFPIIIYCDHNPLVFLSRITVNQRILRWSLFLQAYNIEIRHIKGTRNLFADCLSRMLV